MYLKKQFMINGENYIRRFCKIIMLRKVVIFSKIRNDGDKMCFEIYKEKIQNRLSRYFDLKEDYIYKNEKFDLFAVSNIRNERYMASKKLTIYAFENDEYCFIKNIGDLNKTKFEEIINILKESVVDFVKPHNEHMSSTITGVLAVEGTIEEEIVRRIKRFNYQRSFCFGLKGWADVRLFLIDLEKKEVIPSKKAKKSVKFYQP